MLLKRQSLICSNKKDNTNKYYIAEVVEKSSTSFEVICKHGRLGSNPRKIVKNFRTESLAYSFFQTKINEKLSKDYKKVELEDIKFSDGSFYDD